MKPAVAVFSGFVLCIVLAAAPPARASSQCDQCPTPSILIYDTDASSLRPADSSASNPAAVDYTELMMASGAFLAQLQNQDGSGQCFDIFDSHFNPQTGTVTQTDPWNALYPPAGAGSPGGGYDYAAVSTITGSPGHYQLAASVRDSTTGESVAAATTAFAQADEAMNAADRAEQSMAKLFDKVRDFQKKKRDSSGDTLAINARFTLAVNKSKIDVQETAQLSITLKDCDGTALKNRTVTLKAGPAVTLSSDSVKTDGNGQAKVTVTGAQEGFATIAARYQYTTVTHQNANATGGLTRIQVKDPPSGIWEVTLHLRQDATTALFSQTSTAGQWGSLNRHEVRNTLHASADLVAWMKIDVSPTTFDSRELLSVQGDGSYDFHTYELQYFAAESTLNRSLTETNWMGPAAIDDDFTLGFTLNNGKLAFVSSMVPYPCEVTGEQESFFQSGDAAPQTSSTPVNYQVPAGLAIQGAQLLLSATSTNPNQPRTYSAHYSDTNDSTDAEGHHQISQSIQADFRELKKSQTVR